jgi:hypothetical protein
MLLITISKQKIQNYKITSGIGAKKINFQSEMEKDKYLTIKMNYLDLQMYIYKLFSILQILT